VKVHTSQSHPEPLQLLHGHGIGGCDSLTTCVGVAWRHTAANTETRRQSSRLDETRQKSTGKPPIREGHVTHEESVDPTWCRRPKLPRSSGRPAKESIHPYLVPVLVFFVPLRRHGSQGRHGPGGLRTHSALGSTRQYLPGRTSVDLHERARIERQACNVLPNTSISSEIKHEANSITSLICRIKIAGGVRQAHHQNTHRPAISGSSAQQKRYKLWLA
jgi:hypothetical protein